MAEIDTLNEWFLARTTEPGAPVLVGLPPRQLTPNQGLALAAWLVLLCEDDADHTFEEVLHAIGNT